MVLTADKGVMDKQDYADKALSLLTDTSTSKITNKDPTTRLKNKLTNTLRFIKQTRGLSDSSYRTVYPNSAVPPKFYGLSRIHKVGIP